MFPSCPLTCPWGCRNFPDDRQSLPPEPRGDGAEAAPGPSQWNRWGAWPAPPGHPLPGLTSALLLPQDPAARRRGEGPTCRTPTSPGGKSRRPACLRLSLSPCPHPRGTRSTPCPAEPLAACLPPPSLPLLRGRICFRPIEAPRRGHHTEGGKIVGDKH